MDVTKHAGKTELSLSLLDTPSSTKRWFNLTCRLASESELRKGRADRTEGQETLRRSGGSWRWFFRGIYKMPEFYKMPGVRRDRDRFRDDRCFGGSLAPTLPWPHIWLSWGIVVFTKDILSKLLFRHNYFP
jgi:hypothetical protein